MGLNLVTISIIVIWSQINGVYLENVQPHDIFADAEDLIALLNISVNDAIQHYLPEIRALSDELAAKSEAVLLPATAEIHSIHKNVLIRTDELVQWYNQSGIYINRCSDFYVPQIEELPYIIVREVENCLAMTVTLGEEFVELSVQEVMNTLPIIEKFRLRLDQCKILPSGQDCANRLVEDITIEMYDVPVTIKEYVQRASVVVKALENQFPECYEDRVASIGDMGNTIFGLFQLCLIRI